MNDKIDYKIIGKRIKKKRNELNLTQEKVAKKSNITPTYLSKIESGKVTPTLDTLAILCYVLELDITFVISGCSKIEKHYIDSRLIDIQNKANDKQFEKILKIANIIIEE